MMTTHALVYRLLEELWDAHTVIWRLHETLRDHHIRQRFVLHQERRSKAIGLGFDWYERMALQPKPRPRKRPGKHK
jgi:hypothetical protein